MAFNIKVVSEQTGVSVHTLRQWERRYGVPSPHRADNRYRLYDETDIADVQALKRQIANGISPAQAGALLRQQQQTRAVVVRASSDPPLIAHRTALENAFVRSDESAARQILDEAFALFSLEQVTTQIIQPAMEMLGAEWIHGKVKVGQEHLASNLVRQKLMALIQAQAAPTLMGFHIVAASAPEEEHELGLLTLELLARHQGWRVTYLGQRTPLAEMARHTREQKANALVVSAATVLGLASLIPWFASTSRPNLPVAMGGRVLDAVPSLRDHLPGIYLGSDLVVALKRLTASPRTHKTWAPTKKSLKTALMLREYRLKIAGDTVAQLREQARAWGFTPETLAQPTLYLVDTLACAMAYAAPELMDAQSQWLREVMPVWRVQPSMLEKHLQIFKRAIEKNLGNDRIELVEELLSRLQN